MISSWIESVDYDSLTGTATMNLSSGASYDYEDVPESTVNDWETADSAGTFHNSQIRGNFDAVKR